MTNKYKIGDIILENTSRYGERYFLIVEMNGAHYSILNLSEEDRDIFSASFYIVNNSQNIRCVA
jgi:mRNA degradation ribonuclease J1/J2